MFLRQWWGLSNGGKTFHSLGATAVKAQCPGSTVINEMVNLFLYRYSWECGVHPGAAVAPALCSLDQTSPLSGNT